MLLALTLLACPVTDGKDTSLDTGTGDPTGEDTAGDTGDSADTDSGSTSGYAVTGDQTATVAAIGPMMPGTLFLGTLFSAQEGSECPLVVTEGSTTYVEGDCEANGVSYTGTVTFTETDAETGTADFDGWLVEAAGVAYGGDGTMNVTIDGESLTLGGDLLVTTYQAADLGVPERVEYTYAGWSQPLDADFPLPTSLAASDVQIDGASVVVTGSWDWSDSCTTRPTGGSLSVAGANTVTFDFAGGACRDCVPWTTSDGLSGEWCTN